jgi:hypothetical protein
MFRLPKLARSPHLRCELLNQRGQKQQIESAFAGKAEFIFLF